MAEAIAVAIVGDLITYFLEKLIERAIPYFLGDSIAEKLEILSTEMLPKLNVVISAADQASVELKKQLEPWLRELKHAVHEAEDLLDELQYDLLEKQLNNQSDGQVSWLPSLHSISRALGLCFESKKDLQRSLTKVEQIAARADGFIKLMQLQNDVKSSFKSDRTTDMPWLDMNHQPTVSSLTSPVFGRDDERDHLIEMLTSPGANHKEESCHHGVHSQVIAVYGIGGAGKTTLAQHIYHNHRVAQHFNLRMWVHVTRNFDIFTVTKKIIESATKGECPKMSNLDALQERLKGVLMAQKFLLVLDDLWIDDWSSRDSWDKLLTPVKIGDSASMILVTTRTERTASVIGARHAVPLRELSYEECWSIVEHYAFSDSKNITHVEFLNVGKQIAQKLKRSPLAAKMVGIQLSYKMNIDLWKMILRGDILKDTMDILMWSYKHLPQYLQRCFSYCSIFPKGWRFKIDSLVSIWMAQGFIHIPQNSELTVEEIGAKYFDYLLSSSFFQHYKDDASHEYVIHDLLHDLAERVSVEDCFRIEGDDPVKIPQTILHLSINSSDLAVHIPSICKLTNLRTFFNIAQYTKGLHFDDARVMLEKLRRLRVLHFNYFTRHGLPKCMGHLKHLRYLAYDYELPKSLGKLYQLQFIYGDPRSNIKLPDGASNLINLRYASIRVDSESPNIGNLTSLQNLEEFLVDKTHGHGIEQLTDLSELRGVLHIKNLENVEDRAEAEKAKLKNKILLDGLVLQWVYSEQDGGLDKDSEVLEGLEPSHSLELLSINHYKGVKCPSWMISISNLLILHLSDCTKLESLPVLGHLPLLTKLYISNATAIKEISPQFYGNCSMSTAFPRLKYFVLHNMKNLKQWYGTEGVVLFPYLDELRIVDCPKLLNGIPLPHSLSLVEIINCPKLASLIPKTLSQHGENVNNGKEIVFSDIYTDDDCYCNIDYGSMFGNNRVRSYFKTRTYYISPVWSQRDIMEMKKIRNDDGRADQQEHSPLERFIVIDSSISEIAFLSHAVTFSSLSELIIRKCSFISFLSLGHLIVLKILDISYCKNLTTIHGLQDLKFLRKLSVEGCPHLKYRIGDENCKDALPSSLQSLVLGDCGDLIRLLPSCATRLTLLSTFFITRCTQLSSLLFLRSLPSLGNIGVIGCPRIVTSGGVALKSIKRLAIDDITLLKVLLHEESLASLDRLIIIHCPLDTPFSCEQNEMFKCLTSLKDLSFIYCDNLPCLPTSIEKLSSLEFLRVHFCPRIKSLGNVLTGAFVDTMGCEPGPYDTVKKIPRSSTRD